MYNAVIFNKKTLKEVNNMKFFKRKNAEIKDPRVNDENINHKQSHSLGMPKSKTHIERWCTVTMLIITTIACVLIVIF